MSGPGSKPAAVVHSSEKSTPVQAGRRVPWSHIMTAVACLFSGASAWFAYSSAQSAATAVNLASGKAKAQLTFVEDTTPDQKELERFWQKIDGFGQLAFRIDGADDLARWNPSVRTKNVGDAPIDAIKIEVQYGIGASYGPGVHQIVPRPIIVNEPSTYEAISFGKLDPGQTARIYIAPLLAQQITRLDFREYSSKDQVGFFDVRVLGRLTGGASYDRMTDERPLIFRFHWRPDGFKGDAVNLKSLLEKKPWILVEERESNR